MVKRNRERLITLVVKRDREADECQFSDSYYPSGQTREEVVVLIDGKQRREEQRKVDYPSEWRMNAPPWPDNAPRRPLILGGQTKQREVDYPSGQTRQRGR